MIHPDTELRRVDDEVGLGVYATRRIPRGTVVWVLDALDLKLEPERVAALGPDYWDVVAPFVYPDRLGRLILCWDLGRWVNHSCAPNALSTGWDFDLALRDIEAGEQITTDYASLNLDAAFECRCGTDACRGRIRASDFELFADEWDARVRSAAACAASVEQPLWRWIGSRAEVRLAFEDPARVPSIRRHRWTGPAPERARRPVAPAASSLQ